MLRGNLFLLVRMVVMLIAAVVVIQIVLHNLHGEDFQSRIKTQILDNLVESAHHNSCVWSSSKPIIETPVLICRLTWSSYLRYFKLPRCLFELFKKKYKERTDTRPGGKLTDGQAQNKLQRIELLFCWRKLGDFHFRLML